MAQRKAHDDEPCPFAGPILPPPPKVKLRVFPPRPLPPHPELDENGHLPPPPKVKLRVFPPRELHRCEQCELGDDSYLLDALDLTDPKVRESMWREPEHEIDPSSDS